jgi:hypothetical protein
MIKLTGILGYSSIVGIFALGSMVLFSPYRVERVSILLLPWDGSEGEVCGSFAGFSPALSCAVLQLGQRASR